MNLLQKIADKKTVVVTGAAGGMGVACCRYLASLGFFVLAVDHNKCRLDKLAEDNPKQITTLCCELESDVLVDRVKQSVETMADVWGLVNLVGVSVGAPIDELSIEAWRHSFDVNVTPAFLLTQALAPLMAKAGGGSIVNVGSPVGQIGAKKPSYAASKAALHGLTMSCARNLGGQNIRVNLLLPGATVTHMTSDWDQQRQDRIAQESWLGRLCRPEEVAEGIAFLLSEHSRYMTGSVLDMTCGGMWGH